MVDRAPAFSLRNGPLPDQLRVAALVMSGLASQGLASGLMPPLLPAVAQSYGGGANGAFTAQLFGTLPSLGLIVAGIGSGRIVQLFGTRHVAIWSALIYGLCGIVMAGSLGAPLLLTSCFALGLASGCLTTACAVLVAQFYDGQMRDRIIGYQVGFSYIAIFAGILAAGVLAQYLGWHLTLILLCLFAGAVALLAVPPIIIPEQEQSATPPTARLALIAAWPTCLIMALLYVFTTISIWMPFILAANGIRALGTNAALIGVMTVVSAIASFAFARVQSAVGVRRTFALALAALGAGMIILALAPNLPMAGIAASMIGIGTGLYIPHLWVLTTRKAEPSLRAPALGMLNTSIYVGCVANPFVLTPIVRTIGLTTTFQILGAGFVCIALIIAWVSLRFFDAENRARADR